ncbi:MAG: TIGR02186 family protein [Alphaproteobacteria bacterium]|nr:TIGR02186 family protein [Alphaproteobacteria bacterium]
MTPRALAALALLALFGLCPRPAGAQSVQADLSDYAFAITSNFTGASLLLYGTVVSPTPVPPGTFDVVVVVRGPPVPLTVRRKERVVAFWINRHVVRFEPVPSLYYVVSNRPLGEIATPSVLRRNGIGTAFIDPDPDLSAGAVPEAVDADTFARALVRTKIKQGLYREFPDALFFRDSLFRAPVPIPANAQVGRYQVEVYLLREGSILGARSMSFHIEKTGFERLVYDLAHSAPVFYALGVILMATLMGLGGNLIFRQR